VIVPFRRIGRQLLASRAQPHNEGAAVPSAAVAVKPAVTLRTADQDDRIRAIFGLTSDDPLPLCRRGNAQPVSWLFGGETDVPIRRRVLEGHGAVPEPQVFGGGTTAGLRIVYT